MKAKIFFIVAVTCLFQVFGKEALESTNKEKMDDFGLYFTFSGLDKTVIESPNKTFSCYKESQSLYETAVKSFTDGVKEIEGNLEKIYNNKENKQKKKMKELLKNITETSDEYSRNLESILSVDPQEVANKIKSYRLVIQLKDVSITENLKTIKSTVPEVSEMATKYEEIRKKAYDETQKVDEKFKECYQKLKDNKGSDVEDITKC